MAMVTMFTAKTEHNKLIEAIKALTEEDMVKASESLRKT
jgi:hypothetical protein